MINPSDIVEAVKDLLINNMTSTNIILQNAERNEDPSKAVNGWINVHRGSSQTILPITTGAIGNGIPWNAETLVIVEVQRAWLKDPATLEDKLGEIEKEVMQVLAGNLKLGDTVDMTTAYNITYEYVEDERMFFNAAIIEITTEVQTGEDIIKVKTPTGSFSSPVVTFETKTEGASIYYTTDGTDPTVSSTLYSTPVTITETTVFKAIGIKTGLTNSEVLNFGAYLVGSTPIVVLKTGQTTQYSGMEDDGFYKAGHITPTYTINTTGDQSGTVSLTVNGKTVSVSNETVIDTYTGLEWLRNPCKTVLGPSNNGRLHWYDAVNRDDIFNFCDQANAGSLGGYTDWRISNKFELDSLFTNQELPAPWVNSIAFPNWLTSLCWMSTTYTNSLYAYAISPHNGQQSVSIKTTGLWYCWLVRRGL